MCKTAICRDKDSKHSKDSVELADIFNLYSQSYCEQYKLSAVQYKAINAIRNCRTAALGGHIQRCECCGAEIISYNSCRNRHCPKCQSMAKARWLEARQQELLPVEYFHTVFTIPHEINSLASYNQTIIYNILFKAAWTAVHTLGKDKKRLGGEMGMLAALHTWGQNLFGHIHLHCIIPGGALQNAPQNKQKDKQQNKQKNKQKWIACKPGFLFPVRALSKVFRGTFVSALRKAFENNELILKGAVAHLSNPKVFTCLLDLLMTKNWCVYAKKPFNGADGGLSYLSRYVYRVAISNDRIISCDDGQVTFKWRDYSDNNKRKIMTLNAHEFIRRFLTHVLPDKFVRIRFYGFLANSCKSKKISQILELLEHSRPKLHTTLADQKETKETTEELMYRLTGVDITLCPTCKKGKLRTIKTLPNFKQLQNNNFYNHYWDTS